MNRVELSIIPYIIICFVNSQPGVFTKLELLNIGAEFWVFKRLLNEVNNVVRAVSPFDLIHFLCEHKEVYL